VNFDKESKGSLSLCSLSRYRLPVYAFIYCAAAARHLLYRNCVLSFPGTLNVSLQRSCTNLPKDPTSLTGGDGSLVYKYTIHSSPKVYLPHKKPNRQRNLDRANNTALCRRFSQVVWCEPQPWHLSDDKICPFQITPRARFLFF